MILHAYRNVVVIIVVIRLDRVQCLMDFIGIC